MQTTRQFKGQSKVAFLQNYTVVDIETSGFYPDSAEILEISAIRVCKNVAEASFSSLIKPRAPIHPFITNLTGISDAMVLAAPPCDEVLMQFARFLGDDDIVGYNVNFDINFLYDNLLSVHGILLKNSYVDVLRIARKLLKNLPNYRQTTVADYFGISVEGAHRALRDCEICNAVYADLRKLAMADSSFAAATLADVQSAITVQTSPKTFATAEQNDKISFSLVEEQLPIELFAARERSQPTKENPTEIIVEPNFK